MVASGINLFYNDIVKNTPDLGPAPTRAGDTAAAPLEPARARVLAAVRETSPGSPGGPGATVGELTDALGGHPNTVRHHVAALVAGGLVEVAPSAAAPGRGRPATRYRTTPDAEGLLGRSGMVEEYVALAAAFAERLAEQGGDPGGDARSIGRAWGAALLVRDGVGAHGGDRPAAPADRVVGVLGRLGFSPSVDPPGSATVLLRTCPLLESARRHPEVVCQVHRGLVEGVLGAVGSPAADDPGGRGGAGAAGGVSLEAFARPGACVLTLPPPATLAG
jgi:predicted ArsR family transcriptional regulator